MKHECPENNIHDDVFKIVKIESDDKDLYDESEWMLEVDDKYQNYNTSYYIMFCPFCGEDLNKIGH